jgi:hypothetical protein
MTPTCNTDLLESVGENFNVNFVMEFQAYKQLSLLSKLRITGLLKDKKQKYRRWVLTEEKLRDIRASLEHTHIKSPKRVSQEIGVSNSSARRETQLL